METIRQAGAVALVLALLLLTVWRLRRRGLAGIAAGLPGRTRVRRVESLERLALGPQHTLHLVRFESALLLISASPGGCSLLQRVEGRELKSAGGLE